LPDSADICRRLSYKFGTEIRAVDRLESIGRDCVGAVQSLPVDVQPWQATFPGRKQLPREVSGFEIEAFLTFTASERPLFDARRDPSLELGMAPQIGFLRMSGRLLDAVRILPPALWQHLGSQFGEQASLGPASPRRALRESICGASSRIRCRSATGLNVQQHLMRIRHHFFGAGRDRVLRQ
jgi:hypothetical protein